MAKIPVVILTGFLGAGKTTLLNRILTHAPRPPHRRGHQRVRRGGHRPPSHRRLGRRDLPDEQRLHLLHGPGRPAAGAAAATGAARHLRLSGGGDLGSRRPHGHRADACCWTSGSGLDFELQAVVTVVDGMHIERQLAAQHRGPRAGRLRRRHPAQQDRPHHARGSRRPGRPSSGS